MSPNDSWGEEYPLEPETDAERPYALFVERINRSRLPATAERFLQRQASHGGASSVFVKHPAGLIGFTIRKQQVRTELGLCNNQHKHDRQRRNVADFPFRARNPDLFQSSWNQQMTRHRDVAILQENNVRTFLDESDTDEPFIGIWWDDGVRIVGILQRPGSSPGQRSVVDSELSHADEWPEVAGYLNQSLDAEYFVVPRGRVLFDRDRQLGLIYHGNGTGKDRLRKIAARFGLVDWESRLDEHYLVGNAADELFRDG